MNLREYAIFFFFCITFFIKCAGKDWAGHLFIREGAAFSPFHTMNVASYES